LFPSNSRGRAYERIGLKIRGFAGLSSDDPLDPLALAEFAKIQIAYPQDICGLELEVLTELTTHSRSSWSAVTLGLPEGWQLCILNPTHGLERTRATVMEEIAHVILGHEPTRILCGPDGVMHREYNGANEEAAYGAGAAALVPYAMLFLGLTDGRTIESIARHYGVSSDLVFYRIKITMLWPLYKSLTRSTAM